MASEDPQTEELIRRCDEGDESAVHQLLARHRDRLRQMVAVRMEPCLAARVDASDVVQETLIEASQKLADYVRQRPLPFYPWLRQLAWEQLMTLHRRHVQAERRSVARECRLDMALSDESVMDLAERFSAHGSSPSGRFARGQLRARVRAALEQLSARDREVLVMRHLEQLSTSEIAAVLGISEAAVRGRNLRALNRLNEELGDISG